MKIKMIDTAEDYYAIIPENKKRQDSNIFAAQQLELFSIGMWQEGFQSVYLLTPNLPWSLWLPLNR